MISLVGEIVTSAVNANMFTYEVAPVFNLMEETVLTHMRQCCGWPIHEQSSKNGDGVFAPGGAVSNLYAVLAARHYAFPEIKESGIRDGLRPAMVISKHVKLFPKLFFVWIVCRLVPLFNETSGSSTWDRNRLCL